MPSDPNRILIVEDDAGLAELLSIGLQRCGFDVATVGTGRECLSWLLGDPVDLLLIDYSLPDMTGAALVEELQRTGALCPFIVTTGHGDETVAVNLMKLGALDYLVKDVRLFEHLPGVVVRTMKEVATRRRLAAAELALRESEERYRHLLTSVTDYIYSVRIEAGRPVATSHAPGCASVTGYTPEDYLVNPRLWLDMVHPDDRAAVETYAGAVTAGQVLGSIENRILHKDGSVRRVQNTMVPRRDAEGRLVVCDGIVNDITERKVAQDALARDEAELAAIYDHAPIMMLLVDDEFTVRRLNQAALEFTGKTSEGSVGLRVGDLFGCLQALEDPRGCGFSPECDACPLRRANLDTLQHGTTHQRIETALRLVRGREIIDVILLVSTAQVRVAEHELVLLCIEDVSQQKLAEQQVREQAKLLDVTRDAIMVLDLDGIVNYWNSGAELLYGCTAAEAIGRPWRTLIYAQPAPAEAEIPFLAIREKGEWNGELRQQARDGTAIVALGRGVLMRGPAGEDRSILFTASDITASKQIESQFLRFQRLDSLGSIASGVAHDLNNVLTPIMMSLQMLAPLTRNAHDRELVELLGESTRRGADIIRQLLLFGRGSDSPRTVVNLALIVREVRRLMQETFPKNLTLSSQAPSDLWLVTGDPTQLQQVLLNLCVNARDAMAQGGRLAIAAENVLVDEEFASRQFKAKSGPHVFLRVTDTGTGMPAEILDKIFDPFFTTKPIGQGTGLGLASALGIVRSHGGFITVKSAPGTGSEFGLYFPANAASIVEKSDHSIRQAWRGSGELILLVDDEGSIREVTQRVLKSCGYAVVMATNGQEAVDLMIARGSEIKLVLTDLMMPKMDGLQAVRKLREMQPNLPVVVVSGMQGHKVEFDKLPPPRIRHVSKPFGVDELLSKIRETLDDRFLFPA